MSAFDLGPLMRRFVYFWVALIILVIIGAIAWVVQISGPGNCNLTEEERLNTEVYYYECWRGTSINADVWFDSTPEEQALLYVFRDDLENNRHKLNDHAACYQVRQRQSELEVEIPWAKAEAGDTWEDIGIALYGIYYINDWRYQIAYPENETPPIIQSWVCRDVYYMRVPS